MLPLLPLLHPPEDYHAHQSAQAQMIAADSDGDLHLTLQEMLNHVDVFYAAAHAHDEYEHQNDHGHDSSETKR